MRAAEEAWRHGDALAAGKLLYERLPADERPAWALRVLDACCADLSAIDVEVDVVRQIARDPARWIEAHEAFQAVRKLVLRGEKAARAADSLEQAILYLAENVAKVTYNASGASAPFDHDAGWWVAKTARSIVEHSSDASLEDRVWSALAHA